MIFERDKKKLGLASSKIAAPTNFQIMINDLVHFSVATMDPLICCETYNEIGTNIAMRLERKCRTREEIVEGENSIF